MKVHPLLAAIDDPVLMRRAPFMALVDDVLSASECAAHIARMEALVPRAAPITTARGFEMRPDIRNNDRVMFDDVALAAELFARLRDVVPARMDDDGVAVAPVGLNERFRGYRYGAGHRFAPHFDGAFVRSRTERSQLTVLFYLNDGFSGGETTFADWEITVHPKQGQALIFYHPILHEGCVVTDGLKYVLRSDVMYRRSDATLR